MNSQDAKKLSEAERERLEEIFGKLRAPAQPGTPEFDMSKLTVEDYALVRQYIPEAAPLVLEAQPQLIQQTGDMQMGREAQRNALRRMSGIAESSEDPALAQQLNQAARRSQEEAGSRQASLLQDAQRRGVMGSGMSMALANQGGANALEQGAVQSQGAAAEAYRNRLRAIQESGQLGSQIRGEDVALQGRNADIINAFNQRTSRAQQEYANQRSDLANSAQRYNIGAEQDISNKNVGLHNTVAEAERNRNDSLAKWKAEWERGNAQQGFENDLSIYRGQAGLSDASRSDIRQNAKDTNNAIQGFGNAAMSVYQTENAPKKKTKYVGDEEEEG